ncbi:hypothetical protein [Microbispora sp. NPDC049125]|uniref:hypothetical protein n=1 Tax=Microbispora sp. NPDC049125 TaxID=3154929 RepID=UPI003465AAB4
MRTCTDIVRVLVVGAALTGGAVTLGASVAAASTQAAAAAQTAGAAGIAVRSDDPALHRYYSGHGRRHAGKRGRQHQHDRQHQRQHQFLLRDFTLVLTPFQKAETDSRSLPYNWQNSDSKAVPSSDQDSFSETTATPQQSQDAKQDDEAGTVLGTYPSVTPTVQASPSATPTPTVTVTATAPAPVVLSTPDPGTTLVTPVADCVTLPIRLDIGLGLLLGPIGLNLGV